MDARRSGLIRRWPHQAVSPVHTFAAALVWFSRNSLTSAPKPDEQPRQGPYAPRSNPDMANAGFSVGVDSNGVPEFEPSFLPAHSVAGREREYPVRARRAPTFTLILTGDREFESCALQLRVCELSVPGSVGVISQRGRHDGSRRRSSRFPVSAARAARLPYSRARRSWLDGGA
jgi:hypothetical protein